MADRDPWMRTAKEQRRRKAWSDGMTNEEFNAREIARSQSNQAESRKRADKVRQSRNEAKKRAEFENEYRARRMADIRAKDRANEAVYKQSVQAFHNHVGDRDKTISTNAMKHMIEHDRYKTKNRHGR